MSATNGMSDEQLVAGIRDGDQMALKLLYQEHYPMIKHLITTNNGSEADAKDIYQEGIIVLYERIRSGEFELLSKLKTFIYAVCRRLWLKELRKMNRFTGDIENHEQSENWGHQMDEIEQETAQRKMLEKNIDALGEPCKTIIVDFFYHGFTMEEIAEKMNYTNAANAKNQKYKCLQRLKKLANAKIK